MFREYTARGNTAPAQLQLQTSIRLLSILASRWTILSGLIRISHRTDRHDSCAPIPSSFCFCDFRCRTVSLLYPPEIVRNRCNLSYATYATRGFLLGHPCHTHFPPHGVVVDNRKPVLRLASPRTSGTFVLEDMCAGLLCSSTSELQVREFEPHVRAFIPT